MAREESMKETAHSKLDEIISPEIIGDDFHDLIRKLAATEPLSNVLEIGSSAGSGSTKAFVDGLSANPGSPKLFCVEISRARYAVLKDHYQHESFVHCYNGSTASPDEFPSAWEVIKFYNSVQTNLNRYPIGEVLNWLRQDVAYVQDSGVPHDVIGAIKKDWDIDRFDMVLIDGSEFTGEIDYARIRGAKIILLDDTITFKCYNVRKYLLSDPYYDVIADNRKLRNGVTAFKRRKNKSLRRLSLHSLGF